MTLKPNKEKGLFENLLLDDFEGPGHQTAKKQLSREDVAGRIPIPSEVWGCLCLITSLHAVCYLFNVQNKGAAQWLHPEDFARLCHCSWPAEQSSSKLLCFIFCSQAQVIVDCCKYDCKK